MKNTIAIALLSALTVSLFGCASDNASSKPDDDLPITIPPIFVDPDQPIEDPGREAVITDDGKIIIDNEEWGYIQISEEKYSFVYMIDENGDDQLVGTVYKHIDGDGESWVFSPVEGGAYFFSRDENGKVAVNWERSIIDGGWGVDVGLQEPALMKISPEGKAALKARAQAAKAAKANIQLNR